MRPAAGTRRRHICSDKKQKPATGVPAAGFLVSISMVSKSLRGTSCRTRKQKQPQGAQSQATKSQSDCGICSVTLLAGRIHRITISRKHFPTVAKYRPNVNNRLSLIRLILTACGHSVKLLLTHPQTSFWVAVGGSVIMAWLCQTMAPSERFWRLFRASGQRSPPGGRGPPTHRWRPRYAPSRPAAVG